MRLTPEQLENVLASILESGVGFIRVNPRDIEAMHIVVKQDGPDWLITSYTDEALRQTYDRFPALGKGGS